MEQVEVMDFSLCPKFEKGFQILGKKWNGLIIDVLLEGGPQRFVDIAAMIPDVSDRVLTERLKELEAEGIVGRVTCGCLWKPKAHGLLSNGKRRSFEKCDE